MGVLSSKEKESTPKFWGRALFRCYAHYFMLVQGRRSRSGWSGQNRTTFLDLKMLFGNGRYI